MHKDDDYARRQTTALQQPSSHSSQQQQHNASPISPAATSSSPGTAAVVCSAAVSAPSTGGTSGTTVTVITAASITAVPCPSISCPNSAPLAPASVHHHVVAYGSEKSLHIVSEQQQQLQALPRGYDTTCPEQRYVTAGGPSSIGIGITVAADRFGASERSSSDRMPSGERYHGVSERYPLGQSVAAAVSTERLYYDRTPPRYYGNGTSAAVNGGASHTPHSNSSTGTLDRYSGSAAITPTDRYVTLDKDRCTSYHHHHHSQPPPPQQLQQQQQHTPRHQPSHDSFSIAAAVDRYAAEQQQHQQQQQQQRLTGGGGYHHGAKTLPPEMYKYKDRKYYRYDQFADRFPPIPCPERFASGHYDSGSGVGGSAGVPYMEPPSPAPASDRFIPPPPLSPGNTPSPEVYPAANPFPSPTSHNSHTVDRFIPPPPLSPSPTENYSPKTLQDHSRQQQQQRRYSSSPSPADLRYAQYIKTGYYGNERYPAATDLIGNSSSSTPSDRYDQQHRYVPPNAHTPVERYVPQPQQQQQPQPVVQTAADAFYNPIVGGYQTAYDRYQKYVASSTDPYMRRDLQFHYRLPVPSAAQYQYQQQQQRARYRQKCCQYHLEGNGSGGYQQLLSKSSPGSSSSNSSVSGSQKDGVQDGQCPSYQQVVACSNASVYQQQQQEKGVQCGYHPNGKDDIVGVSVAGGAYAVSTLRKSPASAVVAGGALTVCRHGAMCASPSVEYVGASGGRHVCATPPPRVAGDGTVVCGGGEQCCARQRTQNSLTVAVWRTAPIPQQQQQQQPIVPQQSATLNSSSAQPSTSSSSSITDQQQLATVLQQQLSTPPLSASALAGSALSVASGGGGSAHSGHDVVPSQHQQQQLSGDDCVVVEREGMVGKKVVRIQPSVVDSQQYPQSTPQRSVSMPPVGLGDKQFASRSPPMEHRLNYTQSERTPRDRPRFARSTSTKDAITHYIKRETANFFGVDEDTEVEKQQRWLDRRKRLATRTYGPLKTDHALPQTRERYSSSPFDQASQEQQGLPTGSGPSSSQRPDVLPGPATDDFTDIDGTATTAARQRRRNRVRRKDSVAKMGWDGISYVVTTIARNKDRPRSSTQQWSRSFAPTLDIGELSSGTDASPPTGTSRGSLAEEEEEEKAFFHRPAAPVSPALPSTTIEGHRGLIDMEMENYTSDRIDSPRYREDSGGWRRDLHHKDGRQHSPSHVSGGRIPTQVLNGVHDNSNRRQYGMGWVGKIFGRSMKRNVVNDYHIKQQLDDLEDYRPMFTYWATTVQILVLIISLICYGFGPFGLDLASRSGQALVNSLSVQEVEYTEPANFWWGPRAADLIHLGAKFAPCMRPDNKILQQIEKTRAKERDTACCIRNDDSGCVQSSKTDCSIRGLRPMTTISTWKKWSQLESGPGGRISGSVCGLDPKFCDAPASVHPYEWPDDITKWPICRKTNTQFSVQKRNSSTSSTGLDTRDKLVAEHMVCEVIGHPCCIGIHGQCRITTHEYCDFVQGTFHDEASLCSQVSCLNNVCGMIPFYFVDAPDQIYRLWTSIFLHAGVLQLLLTLIIQYFLMRDLEKLTGSLRIAIIYMGSGIAGNLASAIFVPYRADVGPAGCQFGLLACLIVEVLNAWPMLQHPNKALCKLISITLGLFFVGLLPWVDNYAHLFGFAFGFLISYALLPFVAFGPYDRQKKIVLIWVCLLSAVFLFVCLILLFYIIPVYDCKLCSYFNCLPVTADFCASQNINFRREEPAV